MEFVGTGWNPLTTAPQPADNPFGFVGFCLTTQQSGGQSRRRRTMANQDTSRPESPSTTGPRSVSRRDILKGMAVVAGAAALPTILAACGTSGTSTAAPAGGG